MTNAMELLDSIRKPFKYEAFSPSLRRLIVHEYANGSRPINYGHFKAETVLQFDVFNGSIKFVPSSDEHYSGPADIKRDIIENGQMKFFPTLSGFGMDDIDYNHPLMEKTGITLECGYELLYNDIFRITHDLYTHVMYDLEFNCEGEEAAYQMHSRYYSKYAQSALFCETIGQSTTVFLNPDNQTHFATGEGEPIYADQRYTAPSVAFVAYLQDLIN